MSQQSISLAQPNETPLDYNAQQLALRESFANNLIAENDEDVISRVYYTLGRLIRKLDPQLQLEINAFRTRLQQPYTMLKFESYAKKKHSLDETQETVAKSTLEPRSKLFSDINKFNEEACQYFQKFRDSNDATIKEIFKLIEEARGHYDTFRTNIIKGSYTTRRKLFKPRMQIRAPQGYYYAPDGVALRLETFMGSVDNEQHVNDAGAGIHSVLRFGGDIFCKIRPSDPDKEIAFGALFETYSGLGFPRGMLFRVRLDDKMFFAWASKAVYGISFKDLIENHPELIKLIDMDSFSTQLLMDLLTCPSDKKADNIIAVLINNDAGAVIKVILVAIDNDMILRRPIVSLPKKQDTHVPDHECEFKSIVAFLPQMKQPIDTEFRDYYISLQPEIVMMTWLSQLLRSNEQHTIHQEVLEEATNVSAATNDFVKRLQEELKSIKLPTRYLPGTFQEVYQKMVKIRDWLIAHPAGTYNELFAHIYPLIAPVYTEALQRAKAMPLEQIFDKSVLLQAERNINFRRKPMELILTEAKLHDRIPQLQKYSQTLEMLEKDESESIVDACNLFFENIDYTVFPDIQLQGYFIQRMIADFPCLQRLRFYHCDALDDARLQQFAHHLPELTTITLIKCKNVSGDGISALLHRHPNLAVTLVDMPDLSYITWLSLFKHCRSVTVVLNGKSYQINSNTQGSQTYRDQLVSLLQEAVTQGANQLITALLLHGAHLPEDVKRNIPALSYACELANASVVQDLLDCGVSVNKPDNEGKTALDICAEAYQRSDDPRLQEKYFQIIKLLLKYGAVDCKDPKSISTLVLKPLLIKSMDEATRQRLFVFTCYHNFLTPDLIPYLLRSNRTTLDLTIPAKFEVYRYKITLSVVNTVAKHLTQLAHVNIARSDGMTADVIKAILNIETLQTIAMDYQQALDTKTITAESIEHPNALIVAGKIIQITQLIIIGKTLEREFIIKLAEFLKKTKNCVELDLSGCKLSTQDAQILANGLKENTSLKVIRLNKNSFGDDGVFSLVSALTTPTRKESHPSIQELYLDQTGCGVKSAAVIGALLAESSTLQILSLYNARLGDEGAIAIANGLVAKNSAGKKTSTLQRLVLNETNMGIAGATALADALMLHGTINSVDFDYNPAIGEEGAKALLTMLQIRKAITVCFTKNIGATPDTQALLDRQLLINIRSHQAIQLESVNNSRYLNRHHRPQLLPPELRHAVPSTPLNPAPPSPKASAQGGELAHSQSMWTSPRPTGSRLRGSHDRNTPASSAIAAAAAATSSATAASPRQPSLRKTNADEQ